MPKFIVRQRRPYWVCLLQEVEADSAEEAEDLFYDEFDPQHTVIENAVTRVDPGPVRAFPAQDFPDPLAVQYED